MQYPFLVKINKVGTSYEHSETDLHHQTELTI